MTFHIFQIFYNFVMLLPQNCVVKCMDRVKLILNALLWHVAG